MGGDNTKRGPDLTQSGRSSRVTHSTAQMCQPDAKAPRVVVSWAHLGEVWLSCSVLTKPPHRPILSNILACAQYLLAYPTGDSPNDCT